MGCGDTKSPRGSADRAYPWVTSVSFSHDGRRLASGSEDKTLRLWDVETQKALGAPLTGHTQGVTSVSFSHDGRRLASGSQDNTLRLWDVETQKALGAPLTGHTQCGDQCVL